MIEESLTKPRRVSIDQIRKPESIKNEIEPPKRDRKKFPQNDRKKQKKILPKHEIIRKDKGETKIQVKTLDFLKKNGFWIISIIFISYISILYVLINNELQLIAYFITLIIFLLFAMGIGIISENNSWKVVLIDNRNKISLSLFQFYLWLSIILSGFIISSMFNWIHADTRIYTNFSIDHLYLIGISIISSTASKYIKDRQGDILHKNDSPKSATWQDIFMNEFKGNYKSTDFGKIQLFFISLITMSLYFLALITMINEATPGNNISDLPGIFDGLILLLFFSHIGYLADKVITGANINYLPNPPRNLRFQVLTDPNKVELYWDEPIKSELKVTEYEVYRKAETIDLNFQRIHLLIVEAGVQLQFSEPLPDDTIRDYKVKAKNEVGFSEDSNLIQVRKN